VKLSHRAKGQPDMLIDVFDQGQTIANVSTASRVMTVHVSTNRLLHHGLACLLSDTRFTVLENAVVDPLHLPAFPETKPVLLIVDGKECSDRRVEIIKKIKAHCPAGRIVILGDCFELHDVMSARDAGANGFVLTTANPETLVCSLELVMLGEIVIPSALLRKTICQAQDPTQRDFSHGMTGLQALDLSCPTLSSREAEILFCLTEGASNKVIASKLNTCEAKVKAHIKTILRKIGVANRTQAAIWAADHISLGAKSTSPVGANGPERT
jgi:two-component system, NarL family, nitrate/nitrite response regulator NarL